MRFRLIAALFLLLTVHRADANGAEISFQGLDDQQKSNVSAFLSLTQEDCDSADWLVRSLFAKADKEIATALKAIGYYQAQVNKSLSFDKDCWQADFDIDVGEPVRVETLSVNIVGEGVDDPVFKRILANPPLQQGDILNHGLYEKIKQDLHSRALSQGYLKNELTIKSLIVNIEQKKADVKLVLDTGPQFQFGEINIEQDILNPDFVLRYVALKKGEPYSSNKLAKTYNKLTESIYFKSVELKPELDKAVDRQVPVTIKLAAEKKHVYGAGVGYDTDIGPLVNASYQNRRLNRLGHNVSLELDVSPVLSSVEGKYLIPFTHPRNDNLSFNLGYKYERPDSDTFESETGKLSLQYQHIYQKGWKQVLFLDLSHETYTISGERQQTNLLVPGGHWEYTRSDNVLRPTKGYHLDLSILGAADRLISDLTFVQAGVKGKLINPLPWSGRFITRTQLGATFASDFDRLPASYRYYAGGTETIRGYDYKELGPKDNQGEVVGGRMISIVSAEYEHFINQNWGVATFIDAGNAFNPNDISIKYGTGIGVRWGSPIGPVRLDFAIPLSDADSSFQIHFAAGAHL